MRVSVWGLRPLKGGCAIDLAVCSASGDVEKESRLIADHFQFWGQELGLVLSVQEADGRPIMLHPAVLEPRDFGGGGLWPAPVQIAPGTLVAPPTVIGGRLALQPILVQTNAPLGPGTYRVTLLPPFARYLPEGAKLEPSSKTVTVP
jgi:hypothetical protein